MILKVFAVYDNKAKYFKLPLMVLTKGEAIRGFSDAANSNESDIGRHPEDFNFFEVAAFDCETAEYTNLEAPENLGLASSFKKEREKMENELPL